MKKHDVAISVLTKEYVRIAGTVCGEVLIRYNASPEALKSIQANDFMIALMTGKNIKEEWKLEECKEYQELQNIAATINHLQETQDL